VCGQFPAYAPLYEGTAEAGQPCVIFGRGTQRGEPVVVSGVLGPETKGWLWGPYDGVQRWGTNVINAVLDGAALEPFLGPVGDLLQATFDSGAGADEASYSTGDSSGGLFIRDGATWSRTARHGGHGEESPCKSGNTTWTQHVPPGLTVQRVVSLG